ncbi:aldo/keto reductase [Cohaesibacter celericrescens]|uniref:Oxidoreductase n=1 Tax=Cohaesibacter celericrescens TaxID=2067669 RepID=A0A2N5XPG2_9HYPH|nr:aldo/keto reductase [Cohaesibacter celericrescens]PLW76317.1 oxidoreductase [Cohaesibacter celericrescens]
MTIPNITLRDGTTIPQLGFGIWNVPPETTANVVSNALQTGYRLIDGAYIYRNEQGLGEGIRASGIPRGEVYITTKVWNKDHGKDNTRISVKRSLKTIGVDQLDLVLIHWPVPSQDLYVETWQTLIKLRDEGLIKSIGVSNFNEDHLDRIIRETGETPVVNQIEVHPKLQQEHTRFANAKHGILTQAWTPLGKGQSFDADPITTAAKRTGKTPAQVILRWHIQLGHIVFPRSVSPERQAENINIFDFLLTDDEMTAIKSLDIGLRTGPDPSVFKLT